jgi:hypothetical protein
MVGPVCVQQQTAADATLGMMAHKEVAPPLERLTVILDMD